MALSFVLLPIHPAPAGAAAVGAAPVSGNVSIVPGLDVFGANQTYTWNPFTYDGVIDCFHPGPPAVEYVFDGQISASSPMVGSSLGPETLALGEGTIAPFTFSGTGTGTVIQGGILTTGPATITGTVAGTYKRVGLYIELHLVATGMTMSGAFGSHTYPPIALPTSGELTPTNVGLPVTQAVFVGATPVAVPSATLELAGNMVFNTPVQPGVANPFGFAFNVVTPAFSAVCGRAHRWPAFTNARASARPLGGS